MRRIRGVDTIPEIAFRKALHALGFRYRLNVRRLPGKPDIVLPKWRTAVFVHGCFWHRHSGCSIATTPKSNTYFWLAKFGSNVRRDRRNAARLRAMGWCVLTVWECEVNKGSRLQKTALRVARAIRKTLNR